MHPGAGNADDHSTQHQGVRRAGPPRPRGLAISANRAALAAPNASAQQLTDAAEPDQGEEQRPDLVVAQALEREFQLEPEPGGTNDAEHCRRSDRALEPIEGVRDQIAQRDRKDREGQHLHSTGAHHAELLRARSWHIIDHLREHAGSDRAERDPDREHRDPRVDPEDPDQQECIDRLMHRSHRHQHPAKQSLPPTGAASSNAGPGVGREDATEEAEQEREDRTQHRVSERDQRGVECEPKELGIEARRGCGGEELTELGPPVRVEDWRPTDFRGPQRPGDRDHDRDRSRPAAPTATFPG